MTNLRLISGGLSQPRVIDSLDRFEAVIAAEYGEACSYDEGLCRSLSSALTNIVWMHARDGARLYSYRAAGDLVAALHGDSNYLGWYCCDPSGVVEADIADRLSNYGWTWRDGKAVDDEVAWLT